MEFRRKKEPKVNVRSEETWRRMELLIRAEGRFLRLVEIMGLGEFSPVQGMQFVDYNYRRGNLLKQFSLVDKSLIVGVDEVVVPEIGFSKRLGSLLVEGGFTREDFGDIIASYGLRDFGSNDRIDLDPFLPKIESEI